jgi:hypothetical protein
MKKIFFASVFCLSATFFSCQSNENTEQQEEQVTTEQHDSLQESVLDQANRELSTDSTTVMPSDSTTETIKK